MTLRAGDDTPYLMRTATRTQRLPGNQIHASAFQKHFSNPVSPNIQSQIISHKVQPQIGSGLWFHKEEFLEILTKWPTPFSVSPDFVLLAFVKKFTGRLAYPLEHIFNFSFISAKLPLRWKHVFSTPISKNL